MIKISILEDEPITAMFMQQVLVDGGFAIGGVYNKGEKFLDDLDKNLPDLVFMDIKLKGQLSGIDVISHLRKEGYRFPVVFTTGNSDRITMDKLVELGEQEFLFKPFLQEELLVCAKKNRSNFKK